MIIKTENFNVTRMRRIYKLEAIIDRESALLWAVIASKVLPFEEKQIRVEDGRSYHDGTISTVFGKIEDVASFLNEYLESPVYLVVISGMYKGAYITVQVHLNLQLMSIGCEQDELPLLEELERLLCLA